MPAPKDSSLCPPSQVSTWTLGRMGWEVVQEVLLNFLIIPPKPLHPQDCHDGQTDAPLPHTIHFLGHIPCLGDEP